MSETQACYYWWFI